MFGAEGIYEVEGGGGGGRYRDAYEYKNRRGCGVVCMIQASIDLSPCDMRYCTLTDELRPIRSEGFRIIRGRRVLLGLLAALVGKCTLSSPIRPTYHYVA